uniref:DUF6598 domain-containing protein n=1 Tax=Leersia perrieri TaxID=77586 RepID=A0A0D9XAR3_9ORYZ
MAVDDQQCAAMDDEETMDVAAAAKEKKRRPELTWEEKVVKVLHMVRCRQITEYNHKLDRSHPTRFCTYYIAFFDHDKESRLGRGPPVQEALALSEYWRMMDSINVMAIKVTESDVGYPISIYGTVLARDEYDFRRGRDDSQIITSPEDTLLLTGPNRALGASDCMHFEFHLKIKGEGGVDKDFSKVTAWTTEDVENKIILYDSEVQGTNRVLGACGSVDLTRRFVAVKVYDALVLSVSVSEDNHHEDELFEVVLGHGDEVCVHEQGP